MYVKCILFFVWVIGIWNLEFVWDLVLGAWNFSFTSIRPRKKLLWLAPRSFTDQAVCLKSDIFWTAMMRDK